MLLKNFICSHYHSLYPFPRLLILMKEFQSLLPKIHIHWSVIYKVCNMYLFLFVQHEDIFNTVCFHPKYISFLILCFYFVSMGSHRCRWHRNEEAHKGMLCFLKIWPAIKAMHVCACTNTMTMGTVTTPAVPQHINFFLKKQCLGWTHKISRLLSVKVTWMWSYVPVFRALK